MNWFQCTLAQIYHLQTKKLIRNSLFNKINITFAVLDEIFVMMMQKIQHDRIIYRQLVGTHRLDTKVHTKLWGHQSDTHLIAHSLNELNSFAFCILQCITAFWFTSSPQLMMTRAGFPKLRCGRSGSYSLQRPYSDPETHLQCKFVHCLKKVYLLMFDNNFGKCGPIFKILLPVRFVTKFYMYTARRFPVFHLTCNMLLY